jgi:hypothetical protein
VRDARGSEGGGLTYDEREQPLLSEGTCRTEASVGVVPVEVLVHFYALCQI